MPSSTTAGKQSSSKGSPPGQLHVKSLIRVQPINNDILTVPILVDSVSDLPCLPCFRKIDEIDRNGQLFQALGVDFASGHVSRLHHPRPEGLFEDAQGMSSLISAPRTIAFVLTDSYSRLLQEQRRMDGADMQPSMLT